MARSQASLGPKTVKTLECPRCSEVWAKIAIAPDGGVNPEDITILKGVVKPFKDGDDLACTCCSFKYTSWDMILVLADVKAKKGSLADLARGIDAKEESPDIQGL